MSFLYYYKTFLRAQGHGSLIKNRLRGRGEKEERRISRGRGGRKKEERRRGGRTIGKAEGRKGKGRRSGERRGKG